jgi:hypothetical protein
MHTSRNYLTSHFLGDLCGLPSYSFLFCRKIRSEKEREGRNRREIELTIPPFPGFEPGRDVCSAGSTTSSTSHDPTQNRVARNTGLRPALGEQSRTPSSFSARTAQLPRTQPILVVVRPIPFSPPSPLRWHRADRRGAGICSDSPIPLAGEKTLTCSGRLFHPRARVVVASCAIER